MTAVIAEQDFLPRWASPPGDTISELLELRGATVDDLAEKIGSTHQQTQALLSGRKVLTKNIAADLAELLGSTPSFWLRREQKYRTELRRLFNDTAEWLAELPLKDMTRFGWIPSTSTKEDRISACLDFFDISDVATWHQRYDTLLERIAYRTSHSFDSKPNAVASWIRQAEIEAENIACNVWNKVRFSQNLSEIRKLTRKKNPGDFLPELQKLCANCGVAVVVVCAPSGCRASGATKFISDHKALILLSGRHLSEDHFWFTFFHEAGHVLLHGRDAFFLEGKLDQAPQFEDEANHFAQTVIIPEELTPKFSQLRANKREILSFARSAGISAGLVVGQLQHKKIIGHNQMNSLKRKFYWG